MNLDDLSRLMAEGYISVQRHPEAELFIYNYTPKAQYERVWNDWTLAARGLVLDAAGRVVARPFRKFFNLDEHPPHEIPNEPFAVYDKLDGSLGILYWLGDQPFIATRGSFTSEQARRATQLLHHRYAHTFASLDRTKTFLFEIIYPGNRIVVDYGRREELVLLAVIDTGTGADAPLPDIGFPVVARYDGLADVRALHRLAETNREGFVIRFESGLRVKVKFAEYVRLHRILTQVSAKNIWEYLATGQSFEAVLDKVPDEFYDWVRQTSAGLTAQYQAIETYCHTHFHDLGARKDTALYFQTLRYPNVLFAMLDRRDYAPLIWKLVKPAHERPFRMNNEG